MIIRDLYFIEIGIWTSFSLCPSLHQDAMIIKIDALLKYLFDKDILGINKLRDLIIYDEISYIHSDQL